METHHTSFCLQYFRADSEQAFSGQQEEYWTDELFRSYPGTFFRNSVIADFEEQFIWESQW
jgi:hypothetical protein